MRNDDEETVAIETSDSEEDRYDDEYRFMSKEESKQYNSAALKSDGFDVPYFPETAEIGRIEPMMHRFYAKKLRKIAQAAIDHYNNTNLFVLMDENCSGYNYEIVKIKKANHRACRCTMYYVTFYVKPAGLDHPITTFQAQVLEGLPHEALEIDICRPEPEEHKHLNSLEGEVVEDLN